jgi:hypothetical protein
MTIAIVHLAAFAFIVGALIQGHGRATGPAVTAAMMLWVGTGVALAIGAL